MAKAAAKTEEAAVEVDPKQPVKTPEQLYEEQLKALMDDMSDEEKAALGSITGQDNLQGTSKTPVLKMNYQDQEFPDLNGKVVPKGNWVLGQVNGVKDGEEIIEEVGTDLGDVLECTILKIGNQYSYWSKDAKSRCSSQVVLERDEEPIGFNLKYNCKAKTCPRRQETAAKNDRCKHQFVVFVRLPAGTTLPNGEDCPVAMLYIKGASYMPFNDFIKNEMAGVNTLATTVKIKGKATKGGSNVYYVMQLKKGNIHTAVEFKENFAMVTGISKDLVEYKEQQAKKMLEAPAGRNNTTSKEQSTRAEVMASSSSEGEYATQVADDDDIPW